MRSRFSALRYGYLDWKIFLLLDPFAAELYEIASDSSDDVSGSESAVNDHSSEMGFSASSGSISASEHSGWIGARWPFAATMRRWMAHSSREWASMHV